MIHKIVEIALRRRWLVLSLGVGLLVWGVVSFHRLPIEAYPDVADTYTNVITQWPGHAAEEVEQQITVPLETQLNGVAAPHPSAFHLHSRALVDHAHLRRRHRQPASPASRRWIACRR